MDNQQEQTRSDSRGKSHHFYKPEAGCEVLQHVRLDLLRHSLFQALADSCAHFSPTRMETIYPPSSLRRHDLRM